MKLRLSRAQRNFAGSKARFPCFCGGYGSGKTFAAVLRAVALKSQCVGQNVGYYLPTYGLVNDIAFPRFAEVLDLFGVRGRAVRSPDPYIEVPDWGGRFIFRTMDNPDRIIGYEVAHSICDELDTLTAVKARFVWSKIIARNRQKCGMANSVAVATTPEGFRFVYDRWQKNATPDYVLYRARTEDNAEHLPDGYIASLRETYPANLLAAYLNGEFVNMAAGSVYPEFDRRLNASAEMIRPGETLHVGMDFNVTKMAAVVHVLRGDDPHAAAELVNVFDTPAMIALLKSRFPGSSIMVYPDASGGSRRSVMASESDLSLLRTAGFRVNVNPANPAVKDRVLAVNALIHKDGARRYRVNPQGCPHLVESLEKQAYDKNGEPDKSSGFDHCFSADTHVETPAGIFRMEDLPESGFVMGPFGRFVPYFNAGKKLDGTATIRLLLSNDHDHSIECTPKHQVLRGDGVWVEARNLKAGDVLFKSFPLPSSDMTAWITTCADTISRMLVSVFIGVFGKMRMALLQMASMFTTLMGTVITTNSAIFSYCAPMNIMPNMLKPEHQERQKNGTADTGGTLLHWLLNGTARMKGALGTKSITPSMDTPCTKNGIQEHARNVEQSSEHSMLTEGFAQKSANQLTGANRVLTMKREHALFAGLLLRSTSIPGLPLVAVVVLQRLAMMEYLWRKKCTAWRVVRSNKGRLVLRGKSIVPINAGLLTVQKIEPGKVQDAYCLTAPVHGAFSLANGVVVSNCLDAMGYFVAYRYPIVRRVASIESLRI